MQVEKLTTALGAPRLCMPGASPVAWGGGGGTCTVTSPRAALPMGRVPLGWGMMAGTALPSSCTLLVAQTFLFLPVFSSYIVFGSIS